MNRQFLTVMRFEFMTYMRNKVYIGISVACVLLIAIGLSIPGIIAAAGSIGVNMPSDDQERTEDDAIYVVDKTALMPDLTYLEQTMPDEIWHTASPEQIDELRSEVEQETAGGVLILETPGQYTWLVRRIGLTDNFSQMETLLTQYFRSQMLLGYGLGQEAVSQVLAQPVFTVQETVEDTGKSLTQTYFYTYLLLFLLYMTVMMYGQLVSVSVASEKSNRAMEMLITSARPINLMFGKVIGSGLAGLAQIALLLLTAGVFYRINAANLSAIAFIRSAFEMPPEIIVYTLIFYLTGYFAYAFLYGALGSLASRSEDVNTSTMPIILLFMVAFFVSFAGMTSPDAGWFKVFSFIPFFSPMTMFVRICMSSVPFWQIALSIALMLAAIWGTGWLSARIYRIGVLMYGKPPKLHELARMLRNSR